MGSRDNLLPYMTTPGSLIGQNMTFFDVVLQNNQIRNTDMDTDADMDADTGTDADTEMEADLRRVCDDFREMFGLSTLAQVNTYVSIR